MKGEGKMVLMCCLKDTTLHLYLMQKVKKAGRAKIFRGRLQVQIEQDLSSNYISGIHLIKKSVEQFIRSVVA